MSWVLMLLSNPTTQATIVRAVVFLFGLLTSSGVVPTGIPHGGAVVGGGLMSAALLIPAGETNKTKKT